MAPSTTPALPSAADHSERLNRMNMVLANHASNLAALKRSKPSSSSGAPVAKPAAQKKQPSSSSFSALKITTSPTTTTTSSSSTPQQRDEDDDDDASFGTFNSGIGFVPAGRKIANGERSAAATRDLRGKLLGKRAREQKEDAAAARRKKRGRMAEEEESDEDEGRSKIGKGRKKEAKARQVNEDE